MARTRRLYRLAAAALAVLAVPLAVLLSGPAASAAEIGSVASAPASGTDSSLMTVTTSAACPNTATNLVVYVTGTGFPDGTSKPFQNVVGNTGIGTFTKTPNGGIIVPLTTTMQSVAAAQDPPAVLNGAYTFHLVCRAALNPASLGDFTGTITFTNPGGTHQAGSIPYTAGGSPSPSPTATSPTPTNTTTSPAPTDTSPSPTTESPTPTDTGVGNGNEAVGVNVNGSGGTGSGGTGTGSASPAGRLATTGFDTPGLILLGLWLIAVGAIVVALARSRRHPAVRPDGGGAR